MFLDHLQPAVALVTLCLIFVQGRAHQAQPLRPTGRPDAGKPSSEMTEVHIVFPDTEIYVGIVLLVAVTRSFSLTNP